MNLTSFTFILVSALTYACLSGKTEQPNVLWITSEDNSIEWVGCYGSKNAKTPNIDQLAKEGFRYLYCFDNGAVLLPYPILLDHRYACHFQWHSTNAQRF